MTTPRSGINSSSALESLSSRRVKLEEELRNIERQVYDLETTYLNESSQTGSVLKGFEGFLSLTKSASNPKRPRKFQLEDRLFSLSSVTSPAVEEGLSVRENDGKNETAGYVKSKSLSTPVSEIGRPQKRRSIQRDGKKLRQVHEREDDIDDPDATK